MSSRLFRLRVIPTEMEGSDNVIIVLPDFRTYYTLNVCIRFLGCARKDKGA
jgi:hypothetical protein